MAQSKAKAPKRIKGRRSPLLVTMDEVAQFSAGVPGEDTQEPLHITVGDGPGGMPLGRVMQDQADAERKYGGSAP